MKYVLVLAFLFIVGAVIGWVCELFFRRFFTQKKWVNPGFLVGPYLPLYGFGLCGLFGIASIDFSFVSNNQIIQVLLTIIVMTISMTVIEYIAGLIFIKGMNIKLWDYSDRRGNIKGIICPLFTLLWAIVGFIYVAFIHKFVVSWVLWFQNNITFSFFVGIVIGAIIVDFCYSLHIATKIKYYAKEMQIVVHYEKLKATISERLEKIKKHPVFMFPFKTIETLKESIEAYIETTKHK